MLVIDTDTQANFTSSFLDPAQTVPGVERLFHPGAEQNPRLLVRRTAYPWIDVLPSSAALARYDLADQRAWERADLHLSLVEPIRELRPHYDYVLIDCPPRLSLLLYPIDRIRDGPGLPIEVLQAIQALEASERAYLRAVADYNRSQLQLQWALGWPVNSMPVSPSVASVD